MSAEKEVFNFATIGEVFDDGVSLIFDGQDAATEKHYKVNASVIFKAGDRVKILADSGTYVVEYVVGSPKKAGEDGSGLPAGGTTGQSLLKASDADHAVAWGTPGGVMPTGGDEGQVLKKQSGKNHDAQWADIEGLVPAGGAAGYVLKKKTAADYNMAWAEPEKGVPTGGSSGQVLKKTSATDYAMQWGSPDGILPTGGSTGQVLKKSSATNYAVKWEDLEGLPTGGSKGQCLVKDSTTNYDVSWGSPVAGAVVNQYKATTESYNIYFQTDYSGNFYIRIGTSGTWKKITVT